MRRDPRRGFTLIEVVIVLAILATLAAVILFSVTRQSLESGQAAALAGNLESLGRAVAGFRGDVRRYPSQLTYLAAPLPAGATDVCGTAIPAGFAADWQGPYLDRAVPPTGLPSGISLIQNALERSPATGGPTEFGTVFVVVQEVDLGVAEALEGSFDGATDFGTGAIRWVETPAGSGRGTLRYAIPIRGC